MNCTFNGQPLPSGIGLIHYTMNSPAVAFRTLDLPGVRGLNRAGKKYGQRTVSLRLRLWGGSVAENITAYQQLLNWCLTDLPAPLHLPGMSGRHLLAECAQLPAPEISVSGNEFEIEFVCHRPEQLSDSEQTAAMNARFTVGGTLPVPFRIVHTLTNAVTEPTWRLDGTPWLTLPAEIAAGTLIIDTADCAVRLDGEDITRMATIDSDLDLLLSPGEHLLSADEVVFAAPSLPGTVHWRNAWL